MWGVIEAQEGEFQEVNKDASNLPVQSLLLNCLATCHSLTLIDKRLIGDPLDVKMFESTGWSLEEEREDTQKYDMTMATLVRPPNAAAEKGAVGTTAIASTDSLPHEVGIIRQFTFSSSSARMSVITRTLGGMQFDVFTKGAPEKLEELCIPATLPSNFHERLRQYTLQGFRVIGLAHRVLPKEMNWVKVQKIRRVDVERDLTFLGFLIMQNTLKPETTPVIRELTEADIRCVMVTGDNLLTAISVARDCKMIQQSDRVIIVEAEPPSPSAESEITYFETEKPDRRDPLYTEDVRGGYVRDACRAEEGFGKGEFHLAMSGKTWGVVRTYYPHLIPKLIMKCTVYARMGPEQKAQLIEELQAVDYVVGMCGDGANDCGALKAAHVGISLSEAEASVAAPFTSHVPNITCVPTVIREGRCALVTSFCVFKYMALYSMIQFISVEILYTLGTNLGDKQFLYIDLVITTTVAVLMGWTSAYPTLVKKRPSGSLISGVNLFSIIAQVTLALAVQVGAIVYLTGMPWYSPVTLPSIDSFPCWETSTIFVVSSFQYLILALSYSKGPPYRKPLYTNVPFLFALVALTLFTAVLAVYPGPDLTSFFGLVEDELYPLGKWNYRLYLVLFAFANLILSSAIEMLVYDSRGLKAFTHILARKTEKKNRFRRLLVEMSREDWPPIRISATR